MVKKLPINRSVFAVQALRCTWAQSVLGTGHATYNECAYWRALRSLKRLSNCAYADKHTYTFHNTYQRYLIINFIDGTSHHVQQ